MSKKNLINQIWLNKNSPENPSFLFPFAEFSIIIKSRISGEHISRPNVFSESTFSLSTIAYAVFGFMRLLHYIVYACFTDVNV